VLPRGRLANRVIPALAVRRVPHIRTRVSVRSVHPTPAPLVLADEERVGHTAAELIANRLRARPGLRLLLTGDRRPFGLYTALRAHASHGELNSRAATVLHLDEQPGPLIHELRGIALAGLRRIESEAPLDLAVLGLGSDGHVAFDEPGSHLDALLRARELLVLATGADRAAALRSMLLGPQTAAAPAAFLRAHPRLTVVCDRNAAAELPSHRGGHHVCVVLGHREPSISAEHRISHESLGRLHRAEWIARRHPTLAAVLTGYTSTGGLSEAEQMRAAWRVADVPPLLEIAGRDTAENATRSLPLVLALGDARRVTVVTSAWHLRAPYHFREWREHGLEVGYAFDWRGDWGRMLLHELHGMRTMRAERRRALADMALPRFE
jgi:6-phosphogluconolactonase/glucosamine-6-phosphate isomerase/deaminase